MEWRERPDGTRMLDFSRNDTPADLEEVLGDLRPTSDTYHTDLDEVASVALRMGGMAVTDDLAASQRLNALFTQVDDMIRNPLAPTEDLNTDEVAY